jgi:ankyrin repeat protein
MFGFKDKDKTKFNIDWGNVNPRHLNNFDINQKDEYGRSPLYFACQWSEMWVIQKLIDMGADINDPDSQYLALNLRIYKDIEQSTEFLKLLKSNKAIITPRILGLVKNYKMFKTLINYVDSNELTPKIGGELICDLLNRDKKQLLGGTKEEREQFKREPNDKDYIFIVKELGKLGANVENTDALLIATAKDHSEEMINLLLDWNANLDSEDHLTSAQILKPINFAASFYGENILKKFLLVGAKINEPTYNNRFMSPLISAIEPGTSYDSNDIAVKFLLENGVDPNTTFYDDVDDRHGISALHLAIIQQAWAHNSKPLTIIKLLIDYGVDMNQTMLRKGKHVTPLDEAKRHLNFHSQFTNSIDIYHQNMLKKVIELLKRSGAKKTVYKTTTTRTLE